MTTTVTSTMTGYAMQTAMAQTETAGSAGAHAITGMTKMYTQPVQEYITGTSASQERDAQAHGDMQMIQDSRAACREHASSPKQAIMKLKGKAALIFHGQNAQLQNHAREKRYTLSTTVPHAAREHALKKASCFRILTLTPEKKGRFSR